ncbi:hypothetical protein BS47DRAFT_1489550 [Hydnum rufescens UP504]|uniref:Carbamoyl-phosphate synthase small subunit N-terminal domain-containing protein n=1 Tax=Hydnum rufescens UP504 TaxID=1448309 RepID=A0A9P6DP71_9AGAM|nr:hypothetical protein BS47DRAFT_1489550 [Hydnum rufescens UP504]
MDLLVAGVSATTYSQSIHRTLNWIIFHAGGGPRPGLEPAPQTNLKVSEGPGETVLISSFWVSNSNIGYAVPPVEGIRTGHESTLIMHANIMGAAPGTPSFRPSIPPVGGITNAVLVLIDCSLFYGTGVGAQGKSVSGECVFQTGMVGHCESLTDPSSHYPRTQHHPDFESSRIHIAALIVAYYSDELTYYRAASSLGAWPKENGVSAIFGVDTRSLTQEIRKQGTILGKVLAKRQGLPFRSQSLAAAVAGSQNVSRAPSPSRGLWKSTSIFLSDPNAGTLVEGLYLRTPGVPNGFFVPSTPSVQQTASSPIG